MESKKKISRESKKNHEKFVNNSEKNSENRIIRTLIRQQFKSELFANNL